MDLSNPLATLTPTLDGVVLQVLSATTGVSTTGHIHRMLVGSGLKGSVDGVRRALFRLAAQGIVRADVHDHATLYSLNREHLAAEPILALTRLRSRIIESIVAEVSSWPTTPVQASLFGSFARGTADANSDIDVLIVTDVHQSETSELQWQERVDGLAGKIYRWTGNHAHIVEVDTGQLTRMIEVDDPLVESWRAESVHLTGERLLDMLRRRSPAAARRSRR